MDERRELELVEAYKAEAIKRAIETFNEGFRLGAELANREFGDK